MSTDTHVGRELLGYRIEALLGRGGMSSVYRAEHIHLRRKVALKILAPALAENEGFRQRFLRESQLAASIDHPNIVPIYDAGEADDLLYIAMRYVEGTDLEHLLQLDAPLEGERAVALLGQVAGALDAAHAHGLVHRDVKPGNILVETAGWPEGHEHCYLTDFGLTKQLAAPTGLTDPGGFTGTVDYVAPEQIEGMAVDGRTDVYSLGCVLYQSLTGAVPFERDNELAVIYAHLQEAPPRILKRRPDLPPGMDQLIQSAMAKDPEDRPASAGALVESVRIELGLPSPAGNGTMVRLSGEHRPLVVPKGGKDRPRRGRKRWLIAAALVVVVGVIGAFLLSGGPGGALGGGDVYLVKPDGSGLTNLTHNGALDGSPVWSPDGTQIAFVSNRLNGAKAVYVMDAKGGGIRRLTPNKPESTSPAWSPNGKKIAYVTEAPNRDVWVMNADGTGKPTQLTSDPAADENPSWSPDGTRIAFTSQRTGIRQIYVMNAEDGTDVTQLTFTSRDNVNPAWSPDGTRIAFDSARDNQVEIYVMDADGNHQTRLTNNELRDANPAWSPDGTKIVFARGKVGDTDLYIMSSSDGSGLNALTDQQAGDQNPQWSKEGVIVFVRTR